MGRLKSALAQGSHANLKCAHTIAGRQQRSTHHVEGNCIGEIYPVRDADSDLFSHFRYVITRLDDNRPALLDGVARDIEGAKDAVRMALDGFAAKSGQ